MAKNSPRSHFSALLAVAACVLAYSPPASAGVFSHYSFDLSYSDDSGNGQDATLTDVDTIGNSGITQLADESVFGGGAMNFSADRDFLAIPSKTFNSGSPYSICFWAKKSPGDTGDPATWDMVLGRRDHTVFFIALNDATGAGNRDGIRWRSNTAAAGVREANFACPDDISWHHYAITASAGGDLAFYLDGAPQQTVAGVSTGFILDTIGEAYTNTRDFDFHGQIDELWVFDEALDATKILSLATTNDPDAELPEVRLHHRYDGDFSDSSGLGNDGNANGNAAVTTSAQEVALGSGALALDGADDSFLSLDRPIAFNSDDPWSATWWAKRGELGDGKGMVMGSRSNTSDFIWLNDSFDGLRFRSSDATTHDFTSPKDLLLHHYALVADGSGNLSLYRDGTWIEDSTGDTSFTIDSIGLAYPPTSIPLAFNGSIDDLYVFGIPLNADQVEQIYNGLGFSEPVPLRIRTVTFDTASRTTEVTWDSVVGQAYWIDYSDDMIIWYDLDDNFTATETTSTVSDDNIAASITKRFYRVKKL